MEALVPQETAPQVETPAWETAATSRRSTTTERGSRGPTMHCQLKQTYKLRVLRSKTTVSVGLSLAG